MDRISPLAIHNLLSVESMKAEKKVEQPGEKNRLNPGLPTLCVMRQMPV